MLMMVCLKTDDCVIQSTILIITGERKYGQITVVASYVSSKLLTVSTSYLGQEYNYWYCLEFDWLAAA